MAATRLRVPYVTAYSDEQVNIPPAFAPCEEATDGIRLGYRDPVPQDWMLGVLWARHGLHRLGRPEWKLVNTIRQRRCMLRQLCQVCGGEATMPDGRTLWVLADDPDDHPAVKGYTNAPPTCITCVEDAIGSCPRLQRGASIYAVKHAVPHGVLGDVLKPSGGGVATVQRNAVVPLEAFHDLEYTLAKQMLVILEDLQPVPLEAVKEWPWAS